MRRFIFKQKKSSVGPSVLSISLLVVGGGGSGGQNYNATSLGAGGGGGAGGVYYVTGLTLTATTYSVFVGSGGTDSNGQDSYFDSYIVDGGGKGGNPNPWNEINCLGNNGGSGGGGAGTVGGYGTYRDNSTGGVHTGIGFGNNGGFGFRSGERPGAGGGGGASLSGQSGYYNGGGNGGDGLMFNISGSEIYYGGGGGATIWEEYITGNEGIGGLGGGGNGNSNGLGDNGVANTGGGGGAGSGLGGSGIVIIRYTGSQIATGGTITTVGSDTVHKFTSSGTFELL